MAEKAKKQRSENEELLAKIRERFPIMRDADEENREAARNDMKFALIPGEQWDQEQKKLRGERPCYEFNKIRVTGKRIINDMRANRPQGKVRAVEDGDKATADALEGITRNIWHVSDGDTVIDYAAEHQVFGGMGAWRVSVDYSRADSFEQDIRIELIRNPDNLWCDPAASDPLKRDAADWMLTEKISEDEYKARWPNAEMVEFENGTYGDDEDWRDDKRVRICEYWYKKPVTKTLLLLSDGRSLFSDQLETDPETVSGMQSGQLQVVKERSVKTHEICMCIASGDAILEGPTRWAGSEFPFVIIYGEWIVVEGRPRWYGITRFAKDAQRSYNVSRTAVTETIAAAPQAKYWATVAQAKGHTDKWAESHQKLYPFLLYNADTSAPGAPQRMGGADVPVALIQESQIASEEIKSVTGIFDASLGARSNENSGIAIRARQAQGEIATFNYSDNMAKGIRRTWEILVDLIPHIYDTERTVRTLGVDGSEQYVRVNGQNPQTGDLVDLSRGKYDVAVTVGPSFSTQRQEAAEVYTQLLQSQPALFPIVGDLIMKSMDLPYADKMAERMKAMLPPQIQQMEAQGKPIPPEAQAVMAQAQQALQMAEQQSQLVQQAAAEVEQEKAASDKAKSEVQMAIADLEVKRAQFEAQIAKQMAALVTKEAQSAAQQGEQDSANDRESLALEVQNAVAQIQQLAAQFMQQAAQTMGEIQERTVTQVVVPPKQRVIAIKRENGMMIPIYEDQVAQP
jgi:hypothetical protein